MGCVNVKVQERKFSKIGQKPYENSGKPPALTTAQKNVLRNNWQVLKLHVANVGVITFVNMFETRPELKELFSHFRGKDLDELKDSGLIRAHALRVMATVDKCMARLDEPSNLAKFLRELGAQHTQYSVTFDQIQVISDPFLQSIKTHIDDHWTDDIEDAWQSLLAVIFFHIKTGIEQQYKILAKQEKSSKVTT